MVIGKALVHHQVFKAIRAPPVGLLSPQHPPCKVIFSGNPVKATGVIVCDRLDHPVAIIIVADCIEIFILFQHPGTGTGHLAFDPCKNICVQHVQLRHKLITGRRTAQYRIGAEIIVVIIGDSKHFVGHGSKLRIATIGVTPGIRSTERLIAAVGISRQVRVRGIVNIYLGLDAIAVGHPVRTPRVRQGHGAGHHWPVQVVILGKAPCCRAKLVAVLGKHQPVKLIIHHVHRLGARHLFHDHALPFIIAVLENKVL